MKEPTNLENEKAQWECYLLTFNYSNKKMQFAFTSKYDSLIYSSNSYRLPIICKSNCEGIER